MVNNSWERLDIRYEEIIQEVDIWEKQYCVDENIYKKNITVRWSSDFASTASSCCRRCSRSPPAASPSSSWPTWPRPSPPPSGRAPAAPRSPSPSACSRPRMGWILGSAGGLSFNSSQQLWAKALKTCLSTYAVMRRDKTIYPCLNEFRKNRYFLTNT